ncbi:hypothetical protein HK100_010211 [Physocladia obscura]|uniref:Uncharacterized protein n=1 Tax=Physocladia obscura TaxID=109957 RepID=A0AAD5T5F3_9FUNG|nr:hypothetical protein HK100_010211 [Physocladia obscura]
MKALIEIEEELKLFKDRYYLEKSREIDVEIKTVHNGTNSKIATLADDIERRKLEFEKYAVERLRVVEEQFTKEYDAAVEIANLEFVIEIAVYQTNEGKPDEQIGSTGKA